MNHDISTRYEFRGGMRRTSFEVTEGFSSEMDDSTLFERLGVGFITRGEAERVEVR